MALRHGTFAFLVVIPTLTWSIEAFAQNEHPDNVGPEGGVMVRGSAPDDNAHEGMRVADGRRRPITLDLVRRGATADDPSPADQATPPLEDGTPSRILESVLFAGVALPTGVFANVEGDYAGFAKVGYVIGFEYRCIFLNSIYFAPGLSYAALQFDQTAYRQLLTLPSFVRLVTTDWTLLTPSISFGYGTPQGGVRYYFGGLMGFTVSRTPMIRLTDGQIEVKQNSDTGYSLMIGVVAGIRTASSLSLGIRYLHAKPHYELSAVSPSSIFNHEFAQPIQHVQVILGVAL